MTRVFVYGAALMTGYRYHQYYLQGKNFLGKGFVNDYKKYIVGGGMEGIMPEKGERVQGEVYELDQKALAKLDFLHFGDLYIRGAIEVEMENGEKIQAEAYILNR